MNTAIKIGVSYLLSILVCLLALLSACHCQTPQPFVAGGLILNGAGMKPLGGNLVGGVQWDNPHLLVITEASYTTGGKTNDNDNTSSAGHTRHLDGDAYARFGTWGFGPGASWSKLYTPDYTKSAVHPRFGFVKDLPSVRLTVNYVHPGTDWMNSVQGVDTAAWWGHGHLFLKMQFGVYQYHSTLTDRSNKPLTIAEKSQGGVMGQGQAVVGWRF